MSSPHMIKMLRVGKPLLTRRTCSANSCTYDACAPSVREHSAQEPRQERGQEQGKGRGDEGQRPDLAGKLLGAT